MKMLSLLAGTLVLGLSTGVLAEEPGRSLKLSQADLVELYRLKFDDPDAGKTTNAILRDFKMQSSGEFGVENERLTLTPRPDQPLMLLRPAYVGPVARWQVEVSAPPAGTKPVAAETRLGLVLANRSQVVLSVRRTTEGGESAGEVEVTVLDAMGGAKSLRAAPLKAAAIAGKWEFAYHHGLLQGIRDGQAIVQAMADVNPNTAPVVGVWLEQRASRGTFRTFALRGSPTPAKLEGEALEAIRAAQTLTATAARAFAGGNLDEAATAAQDAVAAWRKAKGNNSPDASNAAFNLASILKAGGKVPAAIAAYRLTLDIRQQALGADHPLTGQIHLELARLFTEQGDGPMAKEQAAAAEPGMAAVYGADHEYTREIRRLAGLEK